ncbi:L-lactate permease [Lichenifustis flavocetrariae]|uniref:L-lactate permease n=1 Tax=Lichenifustis flavocetrariae TaxID=2949735 RepID=A0AA42CL06_9HYPH|nr:L-lactate permease [Lichenifustis flavocetrariae]MCW6506830.1 L-lactate permease [Lichenifustis flavocetrariae]
MFAQLLTPVGDSLLLSFFVAAVPVVVVLVMLGVIHRPGWQASLAGLAVAFVLATTVWAMPVGIAGAAVLNGVVFALWPVMWIVVNALLLYNIAVVSGRFDAFRDWVIARLPNDRRVVLVVIGFCFGALLEGVSGFGTPVAITSALLILVGYAPLEALTFTLIFNTAPVAFGALGAPVTVLGQVTALSDVTLGQMIGRQLPIIAVLLPFYVMGVYGGRRSIAAVWPVLLVSGVSFSLSQFFASNYLDYRLTDVLSSLGSLVVTIAFVQVWRPAPDPLYAIAKPPVAIAGAARIPGWQGWLPWIIVSVVVIVWTHLQIPGLAPSSCPGRASIRRSRSRFTATSPMAPSISSSPWRAAPRSCSPLF